MCDSEPGSPCGSATSALVHGRADIIGNCRDNGSVKGDYLLNYKGQLDMYIGQRGGVFLYW